ncbi:MAG: serine/threonine-protein kinase, partial [Chloroflexota bacterium]
MPDLIGQQLGQYKIIAQLGKGGMATVYKAEQMSLQRMIAVKVLPAYLAHDETFRERFIQEARAVARLSHPHILPVFDFGETDELAYIAMDLVQGGTLATKMGQPLALPFIASIIEQIASALDYAHAHGVVHRDVKPSNIMLREDGETALLTDFGLAKMAESTSALTRTGVGVGTPEYLSPEQGQGLSVDWRTDLYSLGVVMYEMLTGHIPFEAETPLAVIIKHISEPLPHPRVLNPNLPLAIDEVIEKAIAKRPEDRYQKGAEMAAALRRVTQDQAMTVTLPPPVPLVVPETSKPTTPPVMPTDPGGKEAAASAQTMVKLAPPIAAQPSGKRPWPLIAIAALVLLAVLAGGGFAVVSGLNPAQPTPTALAVVAATTTSATAVAIVSTPTAALSPTPIPTVAANTPTTAPTVAPTNTSIPPTAPPAPPTDTPVPVVIPPTNTPRPPTNTPVPPTNTPIPPPQFSGQ